MTFRKEIEQCLKEICVLDESFRKVQDMETLPLSFFRTSIDILNRLKTGICEMESAQLQMMSAHLKESEERWEEKPATGAVTSGFLSDKIARKIYSDFSKSLTLNQRFMFQRDLFKGNAEEMNKALSQLNAYHTLTEALDYLNVNHSIRWDSESGLAFKDLLDKRFT